MKRLFCHCEEQSDEAIYEFKIPCAKFAVIASECNERSNPEKFSCLLFVIARSVSDEAIYEYKISAQCFCRISKI
ncbi:MULTISPECIES: hypothetical protein [unclassified Campylobacter]|uniref:hypothetical protein n=1 Tax=unclassified Campylobacter TaxID=2593542 RepID=UPI0022E9C8D5|nr:MULTISPECIES: hypothetical protein [unclassified Campylobacter]MDA3054586.1 hypothetical protein [Campylobacter sp. VBCF_07 NA4]MDA3060630.1 hypothetical protein [Campylobacter sp. VBCF_02 NA5]MDA3070104.1 hypothetical protein [Campylobacter sp. VBCF_08 NA3]WBR54540.1 hypothetical protein PF027_01340 [Campylobacter sp. VBCF_01 NA2]